MEARATIALLLAVSCGADHRESQPARVAIPVTPPDDGPLSDPLALSVDHLVYSYRMTDDWKGQIEGRSFELSGWVRSLGHDERHDRPYVVLLDPVDDAPGVRCLFPAEHTEKLAKLARGYLTSVVGTVREHPEDGFLILEDCSLAKD